MVHKLYLHCSFSLPQVCIKICDPNYGKVGERATSLVLPCLLKVGLPSQVQEIRALRSVLNILHSQSACPMSDFTNTRIVIYLKP